MTISIFATVEATPGFSQHVETALRKMISPARAEAGCLRYELFRSADDVNIFHLLEVYVDEAALACHSRSSHFLDLAHSIKNAVAKEITIKKLVSIGE